MSEDRELPKEIHPVEYAGFFDFSEDVKYGGDSVINADDYSNAGEIAAEMARRYNKFNELESLLSSIREEKEAAKVLMNQYHEERNQARGLAVQLYNDIDLLNAKINEIGSERDELKRWKDSLELELAEHIMEQNKRKKL